jgi:hypothetical protein
MSGRGQDGVSGAFSTAGSIDRLARAGSVIALRDGQPALAEAQVALGCRVAQVIEVGTHSILSAPWSRSCWVRVSARWPITKGPITIWAAPNLVGAQA